MNALSVWLIPLLAFGSIMGLVYSFLRALHTSSEEYARQYTESAARHLDDMFLFIAPRRVLELALALSAAFFLVTFLVAGGFSSPGQVLRGVLVASLAAAFGWSLPRQVLLALKKRRLLRFNDQLSDALLTMSNALKAGFSIPQAFESVIRTGQDPIAQEFSVFLHETRVGVRFEDALENLRLRVGSEDLSLMILAIETARLTGGNLTEVLEKIAYTIRERTRIERRVRTLTAMGRLQGNIVAAVPLVLGLAMTLMDPAMMISFFHSPVGIGTVIAVAVLEVLGILLIRKIVRIDV